MYKLKKLTVINRQRDSQDKNKWPWVTINNWVNKPDCPAKIFCLDLNHQFHGEHQSSQHESIESIQQFGNPLKLYNYSINNLLSIK
jgi:hypothetical protein